MAWRIRTAVFKLPSSGVGVLHKVTPNTKRVTFMQAACISTKFIRSIRPPPEFDRPAPYDYMNKGYGEIPQIFDKIMHRFDENSKVVIVDGTIASGKTEVAKALANEFEMLYFPVILLEDIVIDKRIFNLKIFGDVPPSVELLNIEAFLKNPHHVNAGIFQLHMYYIRFCQYFNALLHVLSTGQGVVLERCPWSDIVFMDAMQRVGYVPGSVGSYYREIVRNTLHYLMRPNLIVYLDAPVETVLENIKQRGIPYEMNSKAFTKDYLQAIEDATRINYLKSLAAHTEILVYDWSNGGDVGSMIEDIERINFDTERQDPKHSDWKFNTLDDIRIRRLQYDQTLSFVLTAFDITQTWNDDIQITPEEYERYCELMEKLFSDGRTIDTVDGHKLLVKP